MSYQNSNFSIKRGMLGHENGIDWSPSPNFSSSIDPKFLILHYTASPSLSSAVNWFKNPNARASAHFLIDWDGKIIQSVKTTNRAWHAGRSNYRGLSSLNRFSIGIEIVNYGNMKIIGNGIYKTWFGKIVSEGDVVATDGYSHEALIKEASHPASGSEKFGWVESTPEQIESTIYLGSFLMERLKLEECLPHEVISPGRKKDTGHTLPSDVFDRINARGDNNPVSNDIGTFVVSANSFLNMRDAPNGNRIARLPKGTVVDKLEYDGIWFKIRTFADSMEGWVHSGFLTEA